MAIRSRNKDDGSFLRCRTYNHAWDEFSPIDLDAPWYGWRLSLRCIRCGAERHDNIAYQSGMVMGRRYIYPDGYQSKGMGDERPSKEIFREELFTKLRAELKSQHALGSEDEPEKPTKKASGAKSGGAKITPIRKTAKKRDPSKRTYKRVTKTGARKRA